MGIQSSNLLKLHQITILYSMCCFLLRTDDLSFLETSSAFLFNKFVDIHYLEVAANIMM